MRIAQLTDTHVVEPGGLCHGLDTGDYLSAAVAAINATSPRVDVTIVTGDLTDHGRLVEYAHFAERAGALAMPWYVIPGNHDHAGRMRSVLPSRTYGDARPENLSYALDLGDVRFIGLDANLPNISPGAHFTRESEAWLDRTLAESTAPTMLAVHHPPFSSGLWYLDMFGFGGDRRLRSMLERHPQVGRVISGHIHCVRTARWKHALAISAPSSAPQFIPMFHKYDVVMQEPGFAIHDFTRETGWSTTIYRRAAGDFAAGQRFADKALTR